MSSSTKTVLAPPSSRADAAVNTKRKSPRQLCIEGWRFLSHSYALVNQWQLLALLKRPDVELSIRDAPFYKNDWNRSRGLFNTEEENALAAIPPCGLDDVPAAVLRISFPLDLSLRPAGRTAVFGTAELQAAPKSFFTAPVDIKTLSESDSFVMITPSNWSREGFLRLGLRASQVLVVPHGVESSIFKPLIENRTNGAVKYESSCFTFANVSAMVGIKGIDLLLRAFAVVAEKRPDVRLLLKGADGLYPSKKLLARMVSELSSRSQSIVRDRLDYYGDTVSVRQMAKFYQAADVYVSPYRAEGFNLPVLEASACGVPVICTAGGSTDDFMKPAHSLFIKSKKTPTMLEGLPASYLQPDFDHLVELMFLAMEDDAWRQKASHLGAVNAASNFSWDIVADKLLEAVFTPRASDTNRQDRLR
jgi:glycosyltransferase involved in cell wall biosynthesis